MIKNDISTRFIQAYNHPLSSDHVSDKKDFASKIGISASMVTEISKGRSSVGVTTIQNIVSCFHISSYWLLTGKGTMLFEPKPAGQAVNPDIKFYAPEHRQPDRKLIPFYEDIATVGGINSISADVESTPGVSEWIDAGDWFRDATAAIRHYGDSMAEYPSGCILALKKVEDIRLLLWGKNYCIETTDYRITKQLQSGEDKSTLLAYSTSRETYPDGRLIHATVPIPMETIRSIFLVLGCVVKEYSLGAVYIKK